MCRFSRRTYALGFALLTAALLVAGLLNLGRLGVFEAMLLLGTLTVSLAQYALGGWLVGLVARHDETRLSAWFNAANIGGAGVMVLVAGEILQRLPLRVAAPLLGAMLLLPMAVFPLLPAPGPDRRLAGETFRQFFAEVFTLLRQRAVLLALVLFVAPCAAFALTNVVAGLGADFHTLPRFVSAVAGFGTVAAGMSASLLLPRLACHLPLRLLYLAIGVVGAAFTLSLLLVPRSPAGFAIAMVGETFFQTLAITNAFAIQFEIVGQQNPLASTMLAVMGSAMNLPMTYMVYLDGRVYAARGPCGGLRGTLLFDSGAGVVACLLLAATLYWLRWLRSANTQRPI